MISQSVVSHWMSRVLERCLPCTPFVNQLFTVESFPVLGKHLKLSAETCFHHNCLEEDAISNKTAFSTLVKLSYENFKLVLSVQCTSKEYSIYLSLFPRRRAGLGGAARAGGLAAGEQPPSSGRHGRHTLTTWYESLCSSSSWCVFKLMETKVPASIRSNQTKLLNELTTMA